MNFTDLVAPISLSDWDEVELGHDDSSLDGSLDFLVALPSESDVVLLITDDGEGFESGSLTGLGLFLDGLDFHDFFFQRASQEGVDDFAFLDGDGESEDFDDVFDQLGLDESAQFGHWGPVWLFLLSISELEWLLLVSWGTGASSTFGTSGDTSLLSSFSWLWGL